MMMRLPLSLLQILFLTWVSSIEHYWVILAERRGSMDTRCFREWARLMEGKSKQVLEDAMIAATARVYALTVATRNERDFEPLGVSIYNPFKISP